MTEDHAVKRAFAVIEETLEAGIRRGQLIDVLLKHNPRLLFSLLLGGKPQAEDLIQLFDEKEQGRFFRALLVALEYLGWSQGGPIPDLGEDDLRLIDGCLKDGVTRLLASYCYYQRMFAWTPEFVSEFYLLLTQSMFMSETLRDLTLIIVGRLWEKRMTIDNGWIIVVL